MSVNTHTTQSDRGINVRSTEKQTNEEILEPQSLIALTALQ
jgi:hypothetical protein